MSPLEKTRIDPTGSGFLPWELVSEILLKSSVKSLARFKSVSKLWNSYISSQEFIQKHFENQILSPQTKHNICTPVVLKCYSKILQNELYLVYHGNKAIGDKFTQLLEPRRIKSVLHLRKVGSHNGIVCFLGNNHSKQTMSLWNPSMQDTIEIKTHWWNSSQIYHNKHPEHSCFGFGYDSRAEDYKVVHLLYEENLGIRWSWVMLYSLREKVWNKISIEPTLSPHKIVQLKWSSQTLEDGTRVHWLADCEDVTGERFRRILWFDVRDKVFGQITLPSDCDKGNKRVELASFGNNYHDRRKGLLTLFEYNEEYRNGSWGYWCYTWVMKEYGSVDSWTKLKISLDKPFKVLGFLSESILLVRITVWPRGMVLYDTTTQRKEPFQVDDDTNILDYVGNYMESFFSLKKFADPIV